MANLPWLDANDHFPPVERALREPDGLLAAGGDLGPERLIQAYSQGIFPWFSEDQPILWWSPDPRCVILPDEIHISKSKVAYGISCRSDFRLQRQIPSPILYYKVDISYMKSGLRKLQYR